MEFHQTYTEYSDFIWDFGKLPFPEHLGKYFIKIGEISAKIYLKPKVTLHFELSNISLLLLSLTKLNIAMSCWLPPCPNSRKTT